MNLFGDERYTTQIEFCAAHHDTYTTPQGDFICQQCNHNYTTGKPYKNLGTLKCPHCDEVCAVLGLNQDTAIIHCPTHNRLGVFKEEEES